MQIAIFDDSSLSKAIQGPNMGRCQLVLYFCDQIVRHDHWSVNVQGVYGPCSSSRLQMKLIDDQ
jgi:hypothetical protein